MPVTVQEAEVLFSAQGISQVEAASHKAGKALDKVTGAAGAATRGIARITGASLKGVASAAGKAASAVGRIASAGVKIGATGAIAAGGAMIKLAADAETVNTQFKVLTGSQEAATKLMGEIDQFASSTPFQKMEIADAARQLLAFNGSADTAVDELRMLGDLAAGTGQPIGELAELYGKAKVQGRLFGEDINQLTGRGIPIIQALAQEFGVAESEIKKLVADGKVGFPEMQRALAGMTAAPVAQVADVLQRATVSGKIFNEDLALLESRGIPATKALSAQLGVTESELRQMASAGQVSLPQFKKWLDDAGMSGGKFAGMMEELSQTSAGKFSTLKDNTMLLATEMGERLLPYASDFLQWATDSITATDGWAGSFGNALSTAETWYDNLSGWLQDIGVITGVVVADFDTAFAGLFKDITSYAGAAFNWILTNSKTMIRNIIEIAKNAPGILDSTGRNIGEHVAYGLGLSDEIRTIDPMAGLSLGSMTTFQPPELSSESKSVLSDIESELKASREQRAATASAMPEQQVSSPASQAAQAFVSQDKTGGEDAMKKKATEKAAQAATTQRGSALSVFNRIQQSMMNKQVAIAEKQLAEQSEIKIAAQQTAAAMASFGGGFVPVLG